MLLFFAFLISLVSAQEYTERDPCIVTQKEIKEFVKCKDAVHIEAFEEISFEGLLLNETIFNDYWKIKETIVGPSFRFRTEWSVFSLPKLRRADTELRIYNSYAEKISFPSLEYITDIYILYNSNLIEVELKEGVLCRSISISENNKLKEVVLNAIQKTVIAEKSVIQEEGDCIFSSNITSLKNFEGCKKLSNAVITFAVYVDDLDFPLPKMEFYNSEIHAVNTNLRSLSFLVPQGLSNDDIAPDDEEWRKNIQGHGSELVDNTFLCDDNIDIFVNQQTHIQNNCKTPPTGLPQKYTEKKPCILWNTELVNSRQLCKGAAHIKALEKITFSMSERDFTDYWKNKETIVGVSFFFSPDFKNLLFPNLRRANTSVVIIGSLAEKLDFPKLNYLAKIDITANTELVEINIKKGARIDNIWIQYNKRLSGALLKNIQKTFGPAVIDLQKEGDCSFKRRLTSLKDFEGCKRVCDVTFAEHVEDLDYPVSQVLWYWGTLRAVNTNLRTLSFITLGHAVNMYGKSEIINNTFLCDKNLNQFAFPNYLMNNCNRSTTSVTVKPIYSEEIPCLLDPLSSMKLEPDTCIEAAHISSYIGIQQGRTTVNLSGFWKNKETVSFPFLELRLNDEEFVFPELKRADTRLVIRYGLVKKISFPKLELVTEEINIIGNPELLEIIFKEGFTSKKINIRENAKLNGTALDKIWKAVRAKDLYVQEEGDCSFPFALLSFKELEGCVRVNEIEFGREIEDQDIALPQIKLLGKIKAVRTNLRTLSFFVADESMKRNESVIASNTFLCDKNLDQFVSNSSNIVGNCLPLMTNMTPTTYAPYPILRMSTTKIVNMEYTEDDPCEMGEEFNTVCKEAAHLRDSYGRIIHSTTEFDWDDFWKNKETFSGPFLHLNNLQHINVTFPKLRKADTTIIFNHIASQILNFPKLELVTKGVLIHDNYDLREINFKEGFTATKIDIRDNNKLSASELDKIFKAVRSNDLYLQEEGDCGFTVGNEDVPLSLKVLEGCKRVSNVILMKELADLDFPLPKIEVTQKIDQICCGMSHVNNTLCKNTFETSEIVRNTDLCDTDLDRFVSNPSKLADNCLALGTAASSTNSTVASDSFVTAKPISIETTTKKAVEISFLQNILMFLCLFA